ncbi:MAG TPA: tetratricopeptide repeat protein [Candidatus Binatus sp.]|uniref:tetratricopeptide repeat protein n=1 Tax=Candidatus Binatus sp. TaxID=2811406 RepID=UPI002B48630F|nr:tetratricopeptide repeat protein [Candidatus Binatus sp.]HKN13700.1 tetratricopeptide repeat protein [Candidatus Binatus sp.]
MGLWLQRVWFCAFAILLYAQPSVAADLKSAERAYKNKDYATALKEFAPAAKQGDAEGQLYLGKMYLLGQGVPMDRDEAIKWLKASGDQGNADAQFFLGTIYLLPRKDVARGLMWMRLSAEQGNQDAQLLRGQTYMQGLKELPRDMVQADMWMRLAAKGNLPFYELQVEGAERQMNSADIKKANALAAAWKPKHGLRPDEQEASKSKPESVGGR